MGKKAKTSASGEQQAEPEKVPVNANEDDKEMDDGTDEATAEKGPSKQPVMDVTVHRLRHLEYIPRSIVCARATPHPIAEDDSTSSFLALSRENGSIELKAPNEKFRTIAEIPGFSQKVVNTMTWTCGIGSSLPPSSSETTAVCCQPTLVGGSRDGTIFVVDFESGTFTGTTASGGGGVFALSSLCEGHVGRCCSDSGSKCCAQLIAAGCEDGSVRIFKLIKPQQSTPAASSASNSNKKKTKNQQPRLELVSIVPSASGASVLSVAWRKTKTSTVLFAGVSDGTIRRHDCEDRASSKTSDDQGPTAWKSRLRMTVESLGRNTSTRVWALRVLNDGTVVSGDSLGHVQFWDGDTGTLQQSFEQNDSKADVLDMAVSFDESKVFASGVESRVVCIQRLLSTETTVAAATFKDRKWMLTVAQRPHTHDVKALTICRQRYIEDDAQQTAAPEEERTFHEVLCTGGIDTKLCTYSVEGFKKRRPKSLYPWPAFSPFSCAKDKRILLLRRERQIDLYKLEDKPEQPPVDGTFAVPDETHIGSIELESACNLVCATISDDGRYLAASDALSLFLFRIKYVKEGNGLAMIPTKLTMDGKVNGSTTAMQFLGRDTLIAASNDGSLHFIKMPHGDEDTKCSRTRSLKTKHQRNKRNKVLFPIWAMTISSDKKWLACIQGGLDCSYTSVFSLDEDGHTCQPWWSVPDLEAPVTAVKFITVAGGPTQLVASCSNFAFYSFDILARTLAPFTEKCGVPVSKHLPEELVSRNDYPIRITANPGSPTKILLGSFGAFAIVDMSLKSPKSCRFVPDRYFRKLRKRKRSMSGASDKEMSNEPAESTEECVICLRYNSVLHMDFVAENEMVIVEQPWKSVIASFPDAMERKVFGT